MSTRIRTWGIAAAGLLVLAGATAASAQQSTAQQKCVNALNLDGSLLAKTQGNENYLCLKKAGLGMLVGTAQACLTADAKLKVQKRRDKTSGDDTKFCGTTPLFGYAGAAAVNATAQQKQLDLVADIFGANLDAGLISCATNKPGCLCQQKILKDVEKVAATKFAEFVLCKKLALKTATTATALVDCVSNAGTAGSIAADTKGKIQSKVDLLNADILKKCDMPGVTAGAFPGACTALSGAALGACLDARVECSVCLAIKAMDGLSVDCDLFDDAAANSSCVPPAPPVTTFKGALLASTGLFTYAAMTGVPGADTECNSNFLGSHACSFPELLAAESAGELVGIKDVGNNTVTSFWAIDSSHSNLVQCGVSVPWDYQTAHTGHQAEVSALNNGTGVLGPVNTGLLCFQQHWVGCCQ